MKTKIILITVITLLSFSLKAQTDTNVIFHDYIPDVVLLNNLTDTLKIDINEDGLLDIQFYLVQVSWGAKAAFIKTLNSNFTFTYLKPTDNDSLTSDSLYWISGYIEFGPLVYNPSPDDNYRLGVRVAEGIINYYGWIHIITPIYNSFTIDKYAFCKIANYPFLYGQTTTLITDVPNITADSTHVYLGLGNSVVVQSDKLINNVTITSTSGVMVASQDNINSYSANISTAGLAHGVYIVQVQFTDLSIFTRQVVL